MKCIRSVCFVTLILIVVAAQSVIPAAAQTMQQGISVQLAITNNAAPAPDGFFDRSQAGRRNSIATQDYGTEELAADRTQMTRQTKILPTILSSLFRDLDCL